MLIAKTQIGLTPTNVTASVFIVLQPLMALGDQVYDAP
jgi:hypothetical protein